MKTHKMFSKMAFRVFKKSKFPIFPLIRAEPVLFSDFQVPYSAELELTHCWSMLIISESELISAVTLGDLKLGSLVLVLWDVSPACESNELLDRQVEKSALGWGSIWERPPVDSWFSRSVFRDVPRTVPENVRIFGFKTNSSDLDKAPKMQDAVLLNSWDNFSATLPSISSETCVMYS